LLFRMPETSKLMPKNNKEIIITDGVISQFLFSY
jgi:hypothetical protein